MAQANTAHAERTGLARWIRRLAIPIIAFWIGLIAVLSTTVPDLTTVGQMRAVSMTPDEAPSVIALKRMGTVFGEFKSNASAMVVLESDHPLGDDAHNWYAHMVAKLQADTEHVEHVQDFWGDELTRAGAQSNDGRATYVQVYLVGNMGEARANESVQAVKDTIASVAPPAGLKAYVTGPTALASEQQIAGDKSLQII
ncbi:MAG TPA: MMPL family transporter, partial [Mycobacterium sp.]|nr:MMPL family transporter [Mycobacterium sp.]